MRYRLVIARTQIDRGQLQLAIDRAYATFAKEQPQWVAALFDDFFLKHMAANSMGDPNSLEPLDLARAWADQFGTSPKAKRRSQRRAMPAATEFVRLLRAELATVTSGVSIQVGQA